MKTLTQTSLLFALLAICAVDTATQTPPPAPPDTGPRLRADERWRQARERAPGKGLETNAASDASKSIPQARAEARPPTRKDTGLHIARVKDSKTQRPVDAKADEVLLKFHAGADRAAKENVFSRLKASPRSRTMTSLQQIRYHRVPVPAGVTFDEFLTQARKDPSVESAEVNPVLTSQSLTPDDPLFEEQWGLKAIHAPQAWEITQGDPSVIIAVVDSGIDSAHPDLVPNLVPGYNFISDTASADDDFGHGTQVAGIIAAKSNNGLGISGVAPRCRMMPLKVLDANGRGTAADVAEAIIYAADSGCRVINLSLGTYAWSDALNEAVDYAARRNCVVVAAGGNNGTAEPCYPAALPTTIAVAPLAEFQKACFFGNRAPYIDVSAPGKDILTTTTGGEYGNLTGSSAAAAHVSALAALLISASPNAAGETIQAVVSATASDVGVPGWDSETGFGLVDCVRALSGPVSVALADVAVVDVMFLPQHPQPGQTVNVTVTVRNHGTRTAGPFNISLSHKGQPVSSNTIPLLMPKQSHAISLPWASDPGALAAEQTLSVHIPPLPAEVSTNDNSRVFKVPVTSETVHDVGILSATVSGAPLRPGGSVTVAVEVANLGNVSERDVVLRCQGPGLNASNTVDLEAGKLKTVVVEWSLPKEIIDTRTEVPCYGLSFGVVPLAGEKNISDNEQQLNLGYLRGGSTIIPFHACNTGKEVHQWIAKEAYRYFQDQVDETHIASADRISAHLGQWNWDWDNFGDPRTTLLEGTWAEDQHYHNPESWFVDYNAPFPLGPYIDHFCAGGDGSQLTDGLGVWNAAYVRGNWYWVNYATANYALDKATAFYYLGHVAHLLTDMCVPAHTHNDEHPNAWGVGDFDYFEKTVAYNNNFQVHGFNSAYAGHWTDPVKAWASLQELFRATVNYTEDYPSFGGAFGAAGEPTAEQYYPNDYTYSDHHPENVVGSGIYNEYQCDWDEYLTMSKDLMPYAIRRIADLYRSFYWAVDSSPPTVDLTQIDGQPASADYHNPTIRNSLSAFNLTASASDSQSGILKQGYQYKWQYWNGGSWSSWYDVLPSPTGTSALFTPTRGGTHYAFYVIGENGGGRQTSSSVKYLLVDTNCTIRHLTISCPPSPTVQCFNNIPTCPGSLAHFLALGGMVGDSNVIYTCTDAPFVGNLCGGTLTRTHRIVDFCTNSASCTETFTVLDTIRPVLVGVPANINFQCLVDVPAPANVTATDNCATEPIVTFSATTNGVCPFVITRTWVARDFCNNLTTNRQVITVRDTIAPALVGLPPNTSFQCLVDVPDPANVTATDNCDTNPIVTFSATTNGVCPFVITRTWVARDFCNNFTTNRQVITVRDTIAPVLVGVTANTNFQCLIDVPGPANVTATDNCDTNPLISRVTTTNGVSPTIITHTWTAKDQCNNSASATQTVTVQPLTLQAPTLTTGTLTFSLAGPTGLTVTVQRAVALGGPWTNIGSALIGTSGQGLLYDSNTPSASGFYRGIQQ